MRTTHAFVTRLAAPAAVALALLVGLRPARADWPQSGRPVCVNPASQEHSVIAPDGAGGAIVAWQDFRFPRVNIFAQHVLASGDLDGSWPLDGRALLGDSLALAGADGGQTSPTMVADGAGGAIVAWQDNRSPVTETDVYAQHVLANGQVDGAWPANGAAICAIAGLQNTLAIVADGAGGAIVAWMDSRAGTNERDIFAQHVLATGRPDPRWPANGLAVCTAPGRQEFPVIVADGTGGAILAWDDARGGASGVDVFAQHVLATGVADPAWPANGRAVCAASGGQGRPSIATDDAHGAVVAWSDSRVVGTSRIFAQHVFATGSVDPAWPVDGTAISGAAESESRPLTVPDGAGGAIVTWQGVTNSLNMFAQHVTAAGVVDPGWPAGGRALSNANQQQTHAAIGSDGAGGAVVAWQDSFDIVAQHVLATGELDPAFPDTGRSLCNLPSQQGEPVLVATGGAGAIVAWTDTRSVTSPDIFAMQAQVAGALDVPAPAAPDFSFARPTPNPARAPLALRYALARESRVRLVVFDMEGRRVRELVSGTQPAGEHAVTWDLRDEHGEAVRVGIYFARLEAGDRVLTRKLTRLP